MTIVTYFTNLPKLPTVCESQISDVPLTSSKLCPELLEQDHKDKTSNI